MWLVVGLLFFTQAGRPDAALFDALKAGHWATAVRIAAPLIAAEPKNPRLWTARALAYRGLGRTTDCLSDLETALSLDPQYLPALEAAAETAYAARQPNATRFLNAILQLQPENQTAHAMSGVVAFEAQDCAGAVAHFEKSRGAIARNEVALSQFGYCLVSLHRPTDAAAVFQDALTANPANAATRYNLGLAQTLAGQNAAAISTLEPLRSNPQFESEALNLIASSYVTQGRLGEAVAALRKAAEIAPKDERNYLDLAVLCMEHQAPDLAIETATVGIRNLPDSAKLYAARGAIYATQSRVDEAEADFATSERLMPDKLYASVGMTLLLRQNNDLDRAIAILRKRLRSSPEDATLNFLLADALIRLGGDVPSKEVREAREALLRSISANPRFADAHAELGKIYLRSDETESGLKELRKALELDPEHRVALHQLSVALLRIGRRDEARQVAAKLRSLLTEEQENETRRNRFALVKAPPER